MKAMDKDEGQIKLRLPDDLKTTLKAEAEANERSLNGEIVSRLRASLKAGSTAGRAAGMPPEVK